MNHQRIKNLNEIMDRENLCQMLITDPSSIFYLTGQIISPGERLLALLIKTDEAPKLFINALFPIKEEKDLDFIWLKDEDDGVGILSNYVQSDRVLGIDKNWPAGFLIDLMEKEKT